jgi:SNF2 family DNA or RNA helicase
LQGTLRPYQQRGLGWLASMAELGLGACLADDMGLGKTVQLIALLLHRQQASQLCGPVLLVCPTSVVGNWERELRRFSPSLSLVRHYGTTRARHATTFESLPAASVVLTTYGLLRRDAQLLAAVRWSIAALDEAQNIKTAVSRTAQAARSLRSEFRVALTGTPVENRLTELWSIFEFLNPRLLGSQAAFRRDYAIPIERHGHLEMAERLKQIVQPFVLRRLKSDRSVIQDLPHKQEMRVVCSLTREQASLYQAALDEAMRRIREASGIERRGQVLALITALKQICNHPAQYLHESGPLAGRSGKLQRCCQMLEELISTGDRALVFTQYREMGQRLVTELRRVLGCEVPFLHGGVSRAARDAMVSRFQDDPLAPPVFVLSVKAGGTGLNLTAASHVIHYDRWWNPAVEDQATDRAFRIGQRRNVQVHTLLCAGTIEEKVDQLLEQKRTLAAQVIGAGERWITELADAELQELFSLAADAVIAEDVADAEPVEARSTPRAKRRPRVPA